jgi:hypothetical protein
MPRIKWISHPHPAKQHLNGTIAHETRESVAPYILSGQAELCPAPNYVVRLSEESALRTGCAPGDASPECFKTPTWSVKQHQRSGKVVVELREGTSLTAFDGPPPQAPESVRRAYAALVGAPDKAVVDYNAREKAKTDQAIYAERIKFAKRW